MRRSSWVLWVSGRWFSARRASGGAASSVLSALGITIGVTALIVVLGVMNGFQLGYIDSILEISSYHVRVEKASRGGPDEAFAAWLRAQPGARAVVPFREEELLASSPSGRSSPIRLRSLPSDVARLDPGFAKALGLGSPAEGAKVGGDDGGEAESLFPDNDGLVIGAELARGLNVSAGDKITLLAIHASATEGIETVNRTMTVVKVFRSGFYDYDSGLGFVDASVWNGPSAGSAELSWTYGVKLANRDADSGFLARLRAEGIGGAQGWRDFNSSFFGALRTEKTMMMLLVGLIFVVVGVNIYQSMRRAVLERAEEMALIKALGGSLDELRRVFVLDGFAVGLIGATAGLALGLLVATNVNGIFKGLGSLMNAMSLLLSSLTGSRPEDFTIFSPEYFYLMEVPVRILYPETFLVVAAAITSAAGAAALAASRVSGLEPMELLRHE